MTQILDFFDSKPEQSRLSYHTYLRIVKGPELLKVKAGSPATVCGIRVTDSQMLVQRGMECSGDMAGTVFSCQSFHNKVFSTKRLRKPDIYYNTIISLEVQTQGVA